MLEGYTKEHLQTFRPELVVIGNAAASTNAEAAATLELDLPYTSMPEAIYELFIKGKHSIVVAGTHGKTTTTSLMAWLLESAGRDPSMVVGGIPLNFNHNFKLGDGARVRHRRRRVQHRLLRQGTEVPPLPARTRCS